MSETLYSKIYTDIFSNINQAKIGAGLLRSLLRFCQPVCSAVCYSIEASASHSPRRQWVYKSHSSNLTLDPCEKWRQDIMWRWWDASPLFCILLFYGLLFYWWGTLGPYKIRLFFPKFRFFVQALFTLGPGLDVPMRPVHHLGMWAV